LLTPHSWSLCPLGAKEKAADFILFKQIIELMKNKEHLSTFARSLTKARVNGFQQIINIKT
jgi:hypothetical protein